MQTMRSQIVKVVTTMTERPRSTVITIRIVTPTLTLKNPEFCPHFFLSFFMTLAINTNSSIKIPTGCTRMGNMSADCEVYWG